MSVRMVFNSVMAIGIGGLLGWAYWLWIYGPLPLLPFLMPTIAFLAISLASHLIDIFHEARAGG